MFDATSFEIFLKQQDISDKTIYEYSGAMKRFEDWYVMKFGPLTIESLTEKQARDYRNHLWHERKLVPNTINKNLAAIRKWLEMYKRMGKGQDITIPDVKKQKKSRSPKWLEPHEVNAILYAIDKEENAFLKARDRCMVYLELYRGIRGFEQLELKMNDVIMTPGRQKIVIRSGKGGKYDEIDISGSRKVIGAIQDWIDVRSQSKYAESSYFFISFRSGKCTHGVIEKMVLRLRDRSGVDFTAHQLRHTFINYFLSESKDLRLTHEVARHTDVNTTLIYTQPTQKMISDIYKKVENLF